MSLQFLQYLVFFSLSQHTGLTEIYFDPPWVDLFVTAELHTLYLLRLISSGKTTLTTTRSHLAFLKIFCAGKM